MELHAKIYHDFIGQTEFDGELRQCGMLVLPNFDALKARLWCSRHEIPLEETSSRNIAPRLREEMPALWMRHVTQLRNPRFLAAMRFWLAKHGAIMRGNTQITRLVVNHNQVTHLQTQQETIPVDTVVVTAGAWSQQLLGEHALGLDIRPIRGQMLLYKAHPGQLETIVMQNGTYIVPRADGHILVGSTLEDAGFDKSTTDEARRSLHATATTLLPFLNDTPLAGHWAGLRPGSPGNIPTISRHPTLENLYINSGHFRYGVTMAPASARLLLDLMLDRPPLLDPTPYQWPAAHQHQHNIL